MSRGCWKCCAIAILSVDVKSLPVTLQIIEHHSEGQLNSTYTMGYSNHYQRPSYPVYEGWPPQYRDVRFVEGGPWPNAGPFQPHAGQSTHNAFAVVVLEVQLFICAPRSSLPVRVPVTTFSSGPISFPQGCVPVVRWERNSDSCLTMRLLRLA